MMKRPLYVIQNSAVILVCRRKCARRPAVVSFVVLVVIVMLSFAAANFLNSSAVENKAARLFVEQIQCEQLLQSGLEYVKASLTGSSEQQTSVAYATGVGNSYQNISVKDAQGNTVGWFSVFVPQVQGGQITGVRFGLENESAKLNLGVLLEWEKQYPGSARRALLRLPGMAETVADAILDWIDSDDRPRPSGAESEYYAGLGLPYGPRNGLPTSLDELLLVRGVARETVFGPLDSSALNLVELGSSGFETSVTSDIPWIGLITLYSAERNVNSEGKSRINVNDDDLSRLHSQLAERFDRDVADFVVLYRQFGPAEENERGSVGRGSTGGSARGRGSYRSSRSRRTSSTRAVRVDLSRPARFSIRSLLDLVDAQVAVPGEGEQTTIVESPFKTSGGQVRTWLPRLLDELTMTEKDVLFGRINVNTAPVEVLEAIPGVDQSVVRHIAASRRAITNEDLYRTPAWLVIDGVLTLEQLRSILPFITTGGDVYRAHIIAKTADRGIMAHAEVVVDATGRPARQLYWKVWPAWHHASWVVQAIPGETMVAETSAQVGSGL